MEPQAFVVRLEDFLPLLVIRSGHCAGYERVGAGCELLEHVADTLRIKGVEDFFLNTLSDHFGEHRSEQSFRRDDDALI